MQKPNKEEYTPIASKYVDLIQDGDMKESLIEQHDQFISLLSGLTEDEACFRYAPDKWSIKSIIGHIADVERLWSHRILRIARGDTSELLGYDRDKFVEMAACDDLSLSTLLRDYSAVRMATISFIETLHADGAVRLGEFNDHPLSVRAGVAIIAGHEAHHVHILKDRYLSKLHSSD